MILSEFNLGVLVLVAVAALFFAKPIKAWWDRVKSTKGAKAVLSDVDKVEAMIEKLRAEKEAQTPVAVPAAPVPAAMPAATPEADAAHAALDATIAKAQTMLDEANAAKAALTQAQQALADATAAARAKADA